MSRPSLREALLALGLAALIGSATALAATILLTPKKLTIYAQCILRAAAADTYVDQGGPTSNFGTSSDLFVRSKSGSANMRTFVRFDLASCSLPSTATVQTARLSLFLTSAPPTSRTYEAHRFTASWVETTVTWNTAPAVNGTATSSTTTGTTSSVRNEWEVAADVQLYVTGTANNGWRIKDATEDAAASPEGKYASREFGTTSSRPRLTITYYP